MGPRTAALLGLGLQTAALALHRSEHPTLAGRWSLLYGAILGGLVLVGLALAYAPRRTPALGEAGGVRDPGWWLGWAILALGAAHLASALHDRATASRLLDLNVFGGSRPLPLVLEWAALACLYGSGISAVARLAPRWRNFGLLLGTVGSVVVVGEGIARALAIVAPQVQGVPTTRSALWMGRFVRENSRGFRDRDHPLSPPAGVRRLLVIGDSYAFGYGVDRLEDRFGEQLAAALSKATGEPWEAVVMARPGTHTLQHIGFLEHGLQYEPAAVVLLYCLNDTEYLQGRAGQESRANWLSRILPEELRPFRLLYTNSLAFQETYVRWRMVAARFSALQWRTDRDPYADPALMATHLSDLRRFLSRAQGETTRPVAIVPIETTLPAVEAARVRYDRFVRGARSASLPVVPIDSVLRAHSLQDLVVNGLDWHANPFANGLAAQAALPELLRFLDGLPAGATGPAGR